MGVRFSLPAPQVLIENMTQTVTPIPLLVILGPTAVGKSDMAVRVAEWIGANKVAGYEGAEIISADSRQVYKGLDIGTGKITSAEMRGIPHHLLDVTDPIQRFDVVEYVKLAQEKIAQIISHNKLPIICGGTGFYIQALVDGLNLTDVPANEELRTKLSGKDAEELFDILNKINPDHAQSMRSGSRNGDDKNPRRLIRAIEIASSKGTGMEGREENCAQMPADVSTNERHIFQSSIHNKYTPLFIGINLPADELKARIYSRLLSRIKAGMITEAKNLHLPPETFQADDPSKDVLTQKIKAGISYERMDELGLEYRYLAQLLKGEITQNRFVEILTTKIWQYAKRQMTWFKRDQRIGWHSPDEIDQVKEEVEKFLSSNK